jgi:hypothetical protein
MFKKSPFRAPGGIVLATRNRSTGEKPAPMPLCSPQISHELTRDWARTSAVTGRRLNTSAGTTQSNITWCCLNNHFNNIILQITSCTFHRRDTRLTYIMSGGTAPCTLSLVSAWKCAGSFIPRPLYPLCHKASLHSHRRPAGSRLRLSPQRPYFSTGRTVCHCPVFRRRACRPICRLIA